MLNAGAVIAKFKADLTDFKQGVSQAKSLMGGLTGVATSVGGKIGSAFKSVGAKIVSTFKEAVSQAKIAGLAIATAIGAGLARGIQVAGDLQQIQLALETLTGSAEKARDAMKGIKQDAKMTPFDLRDVAKANQALISTGLSAEESRKAVLDLGNAVVATGGGNEEFNRMIFNLQQIKNLGKASAMDIKQFGMAGINIYKMLSETTGQSVEQLKDMDITYEMVTEAMAKAREEGGMYGGALEKQAGSWNLVKSNLKDVVNIILADLVTATGVFGFMNDQLIKLVDWLTVASDKLNFFIGLLKGDFNGELGKQLGYFEDDEIVTKWLRIGDAIRGFIELLRTDDIMNFSNAMKDLGFSEEQIEKFGKFAGVLRDFGSWVVEHKDQIITFIKGLAIAIGTLAVIGGIIALFTALTNPIVLVAVAIAALYTIWTENMFGIQDTTKKVLDWIRAFWDQWGDAITNIVQGVWKIISSIFKYFLDVIKGTFQFWSAVFRGDWQGAWDAVKGIWESAVTNLVGIFEGLVQMVTGLLQTLFNNFTDYFQRMWDKAKEIAKKIREAISSAFDKDKRNSPSIMDRVRDVKASVETVLSGIQVPQFSHAIAGNLAGLNGSIDALGNLEGIGTTVNQYITMNVSDELDLDVLSERLAYKARSEV